MVRVHLGLNAQPAGMVAKEGGVPEIVVKRSASLEPIRGIDESRAWVYGCFGDCRTSFAVPVSTILPAYIIAIRSAIAAATPMLWVIRTTAIPRSSRSF